MWALSTSHTSNGNDFSSIIFYHNIQNQEIIGEKTKKLLRNRLPRKKIIKKSHEIDQNQEIIEWFHRFIDIFLFSMFSIFFLLSVVSVLLLSVYFISNVYDKWSATPVIVTFDARSTSIDNFPFPAVTVCNMNKGTTFHFVFKSIKVW